MDFTPLKKSSLASGKGEVDVKKKKVPYRRTELFKFLQSLVAACQQEKEGSEYVATFYSSMHLEKWSSFWIVKPPSSCFLNVDSAFQLLCVSRFQSYKGQRGRCWSKLIYCRLEDRNWETKVEKYWVEKRRQNAMKKIKNILQEN